MYFLNIIHGRRTLKIYDFPRCLPRTAVDLQVNLLKVKQYRKTTMFFMLKFAKRSAKRSWETLVLDLSPGLDTFSAFSVGSNLLYCERSQCPVVGWKP